MADRNGDARELVCGNCRHFVPAPLDPNNIQNRQGECRQGPPHLSHVMTPQGLLKMTAYAVVTTVFAACAQFAPVPLTIDQE